MSKYIRQNFAKINSILEFFKTELWQKKAKELLKSAECKIICWRSMGCIFQAIKFLHIRRWFHRFYTSRKHRGMSYSFFRLNRDWKANAKVYLTWTPCTSFLDYLLFQHLIKKTFLIAHWEIICSIYTLLGI